GTVVKVDTEITLEANVNDPDRVTDTIIYEWKCFNLEAGNNTCPNFPLDPQTTPQIKFRLESVGDHEIHLLVKKGTRIAYAITTLETTNDDIPTVSIDYTPRVSQHL